MVDEETAQRIRRAVRVPEDADVPSYDELSPFPLTRDIVRGARYEYDRRRHLYRLGPESIAALQDMPRSEAKKALRAFTQYFVGDWEFTLALSVFLGAWYEGLSKEVLYYCSALLAGLPSDTPEIRRATEDDILSAVIETINRCVDKSWKLLEPTTLKPRLADDEYCRRLSLPGIHSIEFRRHLRNLLRERRRHYRPDEEILTSPFSPSLEPNLYRRARPRRPKGAGPHDELEVMDPDEKTRSGTKPATLHRVIQSLDRYELPKEESFYTDKELRSLSRVRWPRPNPVTRFYRQALESDGPTAIFYTRQRIDPEARAGEQYVSARTKNLIHRILDARDMPRAKELIDSALNDGKLFEAKKQLDLVVGGEELLAAVIAEEKAAGRSAKKIKAARVDVIHGALVIVKIGEPKGRIKGEKSTPPLTVDILSASQAIPEDAPDSIRRTSETAESNLVLGNEIEEREKKDQELIELYSMARNAQEREKRRRVLEYMHEMRVGGPAACRALGYPVQVWEATNRRIRKLTREEKEREALEKSPK